MKKSERWRVRSSPIHGRGVFANRTIRNGAKIIEYRGARISESAANDQPARDPNNPYHTFLFQLSDGTIIDGGARGNSARWINHSCQPNCESVEYDAGTFSSMHVARFVRARNFATTTVSRSWEAVRATVKHTLALARVHAAGAHCYLRLNPIADRFRRSRLLGADGRRRFARSARRQLPIALVWLGSPKATPAPH
jgi:hypothetical protein